MSLKRIPEGQHPLTNALIAKKGTAQAVCADNVIKAKHTCSLNTHTAPNLDHEIKNDNTPQGLDIYIICCLASQGKYMPTWLPWRRVRGGFWSSLIVNCQLMSYEQ